MSDKKWSEPKGKKYAVTDGCFVWNKKSKRDAEKSAKELSKTHYNTWVVTPKESGGFKIIKKFVNEKEIK